MTEAEKQIIVESYVGMNEPIGGYNAVYNWLYMKMTRMVIAMEVFDEK